MSANLTPAHHLASSINNFQNTSGPDIDLDRTINYSAVVGAALTNEEELQQKRAGPKKGREFTINVSIIIMSTVVFLAILAWFDFMQTTFYTWLQPETQVDFPTPANKLYYALLSTGVVIVICCLVVLYHEKLQI